VVLDLRKRIVINESPPSDSVGCIWTVAIVSSSPYVGSKPGYIQKKKEIHLPRLTATDNGVRRASGLCWLCLRNGTRRLRGRQGVRPSVVTPNPGPTWWPGAPTLFGNCVSKIPSRLAGLGQVSRAVVDQQIWARVRFEEFKGPPVTGPSPNHLGLACNLLCPDTAIVYRWCSDALSYEYYC